MKKINVVVLIFLIVGTTCFFWFSTNTKDEPSLSHFPESLIEFVVSNKIDDEEYDQEALKLSKEASYHENLGQSFYSTALGSHFYSKDKLSLLKASKKHLLIAKKLRD